MVDGKKGRKIKWKNNHLASYMNSNTEIKEHENIPYSVDRPVAFNRHWGKNHPRFPSQKNFVSLPGLKLSP